MVFPRRAAVVSTALLTVLACGRAPTVSQPRQDANPQPEAMARPARPAGTGGSALDGTLFGQVIERARTLASGPVAAAAPARLPDALADMDYEQYRAITFRPEAAIWRGESPFEVQLFHPGFLYTEPVRLHLVQDGRVDDLTFDPGRFRFEGPAAPFAAALVPDLGYTGFRVHYPLNRDTVAEEMLLFLGASYFRIVGPGQVYGLSARGLAVDVATERDEEFPAFREFWLVRPPADGATATFYALLAGPSVTGAYRFDLAPGSPTCLDVDARLFARRDGAKIGVAPLSSMFLYGQNRMPAFDDFRPQVHDSDGLMMLTGSGEWIWRPLNNGPGLQVTSLRDRSPRGFGLAQRDRDFESYLDVEAQYHRRPSLWVDTAGEAWGSGGVELLTIPTDSEFNDNIAAYWVPDEPFQAGAARRYRYRLVTFGRRLDAQTLAQVDRLRIGRDGLPGGSPGAPCGRRRFVVDFGAGDLPSLDPTAPVRAELTTSAGAATTPVVQALPDGHGWRAAFVLTPARRPADMRLYLEMDGRRLSETWTYVWYPERDE